MEEFYHSLNPLKTAYAKAVMEQVEKHFGNGKLDFKTRLAIQMASDPNLDMVVELTKHNIKAS